MHQIFDSFKVYAFVILFVVGWWVLAFHDEHRNNALPIAIQTTKHPDPLTSSRLAFVTREKLQQALSGDYALMAQLIIDWEIDAQLMYSTGIDARRLVPDDFLQAQRLAREINAGILSATPLEIYRPKFVVDDAGKSIPLDRPFKRFLPQTFAAASFLLALTSPDEIVALPRSLRDQVQLYPKALTDSISLDIDRHNAEKIYLKHPDIAFIAHYSHPTTVQALINQDVTLYTMKNLNTLYDIGDELLHLGHIVNRPLQAQMLKIFLDAAIIAIDNQLLLLTNSHKNHSRRILYLTYHQNFTIPTTKTLTGQLLKRLGNSDISLKYSDDTDKSSEWTIPIDKEHILNLDPDGIIIAAENPKALEHELSHDAVFKQILSKKPNCIAFLDEATQNTPTQYIILAYFDIVQSLMRLQ